MSKVSICCKNVVAQTVTPAWRYALVNCLLYCNCGIREFIRSTTKTSTYYIVVNWVSITALKFEFLPHRTLIPMDTVSLQLKWLMLSTGSLGATFIATRVRRVDLLLVSCNWRSLLSGSWQESSQKPSTTCQSDLRLRYHQGEIS